MATQLHVAFSFIFKGAAIIEGGPYKGGSFMQTINGKSKHSEEESKEIEDKYFKQVSDATKEAASN